MNDQVQEVKEKNDIVEIIGGYLTLKKAGVNYKANCPFHSEKTPSFMVNPERQSFKCFGCGEGGDVITFVEKMEGLDFYNALKLLAEKAGVTLKSDSIQYGNKQHSADKKTRLFEINEWAAKVYNKLLLDHPKAEGARKYLSKRGLTEEIIKKFNIGYAPNSWDFLLRFLISKKYSEAEAVEAGVAIRSEKGKIYDRFRGRVVFPIANPMGTIVAFTARILEDDGQSAKYINSAESLIYTKGKVIYGLDKAKVAIKDAGLAVMVEGNMDVIACHQAGFANVVATSGTALTIEQLKILSRYASQIAFCFDTDNAGQTAMKRAVRLAMANDITTKIITTAPFKDADEAIKADPKNWLKMVEGAKPSLEYWIDQLIAENPKLEVSDKKKIAKEILPVVKVTLSEIEREHYIRYLAGKLSVSEDSLIEALDRAKASNEFSVKSDSSQVAKTEKLSLVEKILGFVWAEPDLASKINLELPQPSKELLPFFEIIRSKSEISREKIAPGLALKLDNFAMTVLRDIDPENHELVETEFLFSLGRLKSDQKETIKNEYARKIAAAEKNGDKEALKKLLQEFSALIK